MAADVLLYAGSGIIIVWGIAHIAPTSSVVKGFGSLSDDNRRIITMEWAAEGLALIFVGVLVLLVTALGDSGDSTALVVYRASAAMLLVMAAWTAMTGARTSIIPMKICPFVKTAVAAMFITASLI